jgi:hypothetical protein
LKWKRRFFYFMRERKSQTGLLCRNRLVAADERDERGQK